MNKRDNKTVSRVIKSGIVAGALFTMTSVSSDAATNFFDYNMMGSGSEVRAEILNTDASTAPFVSLEMNCGEKKSEGKSEEAKCGEGKKAKEGDSAKKSDSKTKEATCGEGKAKEAKCGESKTKEAKCGEGKTKDAKCGEDKKSDSKSKEAKCGENTCGA